jgi:hypothetical protein
MSRIACLAILLAAILAIAGCATAPQAPVNLASQDVKWEGERVGVAMTALPKVDFAYPGAACLLCMAAASMANSTLIDYTRTLPNEDLRGLKQEISDQLQKRKAQVQVIDEPLNLKGLPDFPAKPDHAPKDFSSIAKRYNIDWLYIVQLDSVGIERTYSGYVPTGDPKGQVKGAGYLVDLRTNKYSWFQPVQVAKSADGAWDEPPKFPGLSNAYFQALELARDAFKGPLLQ